MLISFGSIVLVLEGGLYAKCEVDSLTIDDVQLIYPYGLSGSPAAPLPNALVLILRSGTNTFGIPYNEFLRDPLAPGEVQVGNPLIKSSISFKASGDIEILGPTNVTVTSTGIVTINGSLVNLGDALGFALNTTSLMQVVIPSGSSAGTYPVIITNPGNTKVKV